MNNILSNMLRFLVLIALQVFVCSQINLFGFATPAVYLLALLLLPLELPLSAQYFIGFVTGLVIDMFAHTLGVNAFACVMVMFARPYLVRNLNAGKASEGIDRPVPGVKDFKWLFIYTSILSLLHQICVVMLETLSFANFGHTLLAILCNTIFTIFLLLCLLYIFFSAERKY